SGFATLIGGVSSGVEHSSNLNFKQVTATGDRITFQDAKNLINRDDVQTTLQDWLKTPNQQVFVVGTVLRTQQLSVTAGSSISGKIVLNGEEVPKCSDNSSQNSPSSASNESSASSSGSSATDST